MKRNPITYLPTNSQPIVKFFPHFELGSTVPNDSHILLGHLQGREELKYKLDHLGKLQIRKRDNVTRTKYILNFIIIF